MLADTGFASAALGAILLRPDRKGEPTRCGRLGGMRQ
jgi:hypothetical protein